MRRRSLFNGNERSDDILSSPAYSSSPTLPLQFDCGQLINSTIVRKIGEGKQKTSFEIILPNNIRAAAKRCHSKGCFDRHLLMKEDHFFRNLYQQYGDQAIQYYGFCSYAPGNIKKQKAREASLSDFTVGDTLFLELATPLKSDWKENEDEPNQLNVHNEDDLESLRVIARQYDEFAGGRLQLRKDNKYPHQYVRTKTGIRHADFDMMQVLPPTSPSILNQNCQFLMWSLGRLRAEDRRVDCTEAYSQE